MPHYIVSDEYKALGHNKENTLFELVYLACNELLGITTLLENIDESANLSGEELHLVRLSLMRPLTELREICSQLTEYRLLHKIIAR